MKQAEVNRVQAELEKALEHLKSAERMLKPHEDDADVYQAICLIPSTAVRQTIRYVERLKGSGQ